MAVQAPNKPRPWLGRGLRGLAVLVGVVAVAAVVWDLVSPARSTGTPLAQQGFRAGAWLGMAMRTAVLGGLSLLLWSKGRAVSDPERYGLFALTKRRLAEIVETERDRFLEEPTGVDGFYSANTDEELLSLYRSIDPAAAAERFNELVLEVRRRYEAFGREGEQTD